MSWVLGFIPTPSFINKSDLKRDFEDFAQKMRCKWYFKNDVTEIFSQLPAFQNKCNWNPPKEQPALEIFLSQIEGDIFSVLPGNTSSYKLTKNEWLVMRGLVEDRRIIIKPADKGSCIVVWDQADYLAEAENHLSDSSTYKKVKLKKAIGCLNNFSQRKLYLLTNTSISLMVIKNQPI